MNVIAINGSPRIGGNSDVLCGQFLKGAKEAGCETEKVKTGAWEKGDILGLPVMQKGYEAGKNLKNN